MESLDRYNLLLVENDRLLARLGALISVEHLGGGYCAKCLVADYDEIHKKSEGVVYSFSCSKRGRPPAPNSETVDRAVFQLENYHRQLSGAITLVEELGITTAVEPAIIQRAPAEDDDSIVDLLKIREDHINHQNSANRFSRCFRSVRRRLKN